MDHSQLKRVSQREDDPFFSEIAVKISRLTANVEKVIKGKSEIIQLCVIGLLARGHILIEDIPGVGKSTLAQCLARSMGLAFQRIQFTSDLLPSDILGLSVYDEKKQDFILRKGPIFANIILADEINRSTPKTQSALLEAMNENHVTIDRDTHILPSPFMVLATQNPVDHRGTFALPESQLDRFMLRVRMGYPDMEHERHILRQQLINQESLAETLHEVVTLEEIIQMQEALRRVVLSETVETYLLQVIQGTRHSELLALGGSTRSALSLSHAVKARALVLGRSYCIPDDVKHLALPVLGHRLVLEQRVGDSRRRLQDAEDIIAEIVQRIPVPI